MEKALKIRARAWRLTSFLFCGGLGVAALSSACGHASERGAATPAMEAQDLPPADAIPGEFEVRVKVVATSAGDEKEMEGRLRKLPGQLALTGLGSDGKAVFLLEQTDTKVTFTPYTTKTWTFSPTYVLGDLHRIFDAPLGAAIPDGQRSGLVKSVLVKEHWQEGQLRHRSYTETEGTGSLPKVSIAYQGAGPQRLPAHVVLKNHGIGYTLALDLTVP